MFSSNDRISTRQSFRLFLFDFVGVSSLIVPSYLARTTGADGVCSIVLGAVLGLVYLLLLYEISERMGTDMGTFLKESLSVSIRFPVQLVLLLHCVAVAGFAAYLFGTLMQYSLLPDGSIRVILPVVLVIAGYAVSGGIESRARVYELLFFFILIPLVIMLFSAGTQMEGAYFQSFWEADFLSLLKGGYLVFLFFGIAFWTLFFPKYLQPDRPVGIFFKRVGWALFCSAALLMAVYLISLGNFGEEALADMDFPVITLMSSIKIPGNFVKRLDAFMIGVWFFTLFAFLNLHVFYGADMLREMIGEKGKKRYVAGTLVAAGILALLFYENKTLLQVFFGYIWYVGTPLMIILPIFVCWMGRGRKT